MTNGEFVKQTRTRLGWTQPKAAQWFDVSVSTFIAWEKDKTRVPMAVKRVCTSINALLNLAHVWAQSPFDCEPQKAIFDLGLGGVLYILFGGILPTISQGNEPQPLEPEPEPPKEAPQQTTETTTRDWVGIEEIASHLRAKTSHIRNLLKADDPIPAHKVGRLWRFDKNEVDQWMMERMVYPDDWEQNTNSQSKM